MDNGRCGVCTVAERHGHTHAELAAASRRQDEVVEEVRGAARAYIWDLIPTPDQERRLAHLCGPQGRSLVRAWIGDDMPKLTEAANEDMVPWADRIARRLAGWL